MTDETVTDLVEMELPFGRRARLREVRHESGLRMIRLILREGKRITQVDMDEVSAMRLGQALTGAAADGERP